MNKYFIQAHFKTPELFLSDKEITGVTEAITEIKGFWKAHVEMFIEFSEQLMETDAWKTGSHKLISKSTYDIQTTGSIKQGQKKQLQLCRTVTQTNSHRQASHGENYLTPVKDGGKVTNAYNKGNPIRIVFAVHKKYFY